MASVVGVSSICRLPCLHLPQQTRKHFSLPFLANFHYSSNCILEASSCTRNLKVRSNRVAPSATATINTSDEEESYDEHGTFFDGFNVATASEDDDEEQQAEASSESDELSVSRLGLPEELVEALEKRDITQLFPIQRAVLVPALEGRDLIARAKTGTGKTLAFGIPIIKRLVEDESSSRRQHRRPPRLLVLAPTRELAKQVENEFQLSAPFLDTICVYGGVSYNAQKSALSRGVDVVVGTPGRIIDLLNDGSLDLREIGYLVLDEADQMLAVGFEEDVELILDKLPEERQSMLFSATMPGWVNKLARKYLNDPLTIDLVGDEDEKLAEGIKLYALSVTETAKRSILADLITIYAKGGKTIVFTKTKLDADNVSISLASNVTSEALHGDISQYSRERTLNGFRDGKFTVLVATDVAARGLDIPNVDLVIHYELPNDPETFVHRSGRTGRAGKEGTAILMYTSSQRRTVKILEQDVGCSFEFVNPPTFDEVLESSSTQVVATLNRVHPECTQYFSQTAQNLIDEKGTTALAAALAQLCGFSRPPTVRSLLTHEEGLMTLQLTRTRGFVSARVVNGILADIYPAAAGEIGKIYTIADTKVCGAVLDLPEQIANDLLQIQPPPGTQICKISKLPPLQDDGPRYDDYGRYSERDDRGRYSRRDDDGRYSGRDDRGRYSRRDDRGRYSRRDDNGRYSGRERVSRWRSRQRDSFSNSRGWNTREYDDDDDNEYSQGGSRYGSDSKWSRNSGSSRNSDGGRRRSRLMDPSYWKR